MGDNTTKINLADSVKFKPQWLTLSNDLKSRNQSPPLLPEPENPRRSQNFRERPRFSKNYLTPTKLSSQSYKRFGSQSPPRLNRSLSLVSLRTQNNDRIESRDLIHEPRMYKERPNFERERKNFPHMREQRKSKSASNLFPLGISPSKLNSIQAKTKPQKPTVLILPSSRGSSTLEVVSPSSMKTSPTRRTGQTTRFSPTPHNGSILQYNSSNDRNSIERSLNERNSIEKTSNEQTSELERARSLVPNQPQVPKLLAKSRSEVNLLKGHLKSSVPTTPTKLPPFLSKKNTL